MKALRRVLTLAALVLVVGACGAPPGVARPPEVRYGRSVCDRCGMIISDERFACGYVLKSGETRIFDDIGEMVEELRERRPIDAAVFVHDYETKGWIRAEGASFVYSVDVRSPMGGGLAAFTSRERAQALASRYGEAAVTWDKLLAGEQARAPAGASPRYVEDSGA
ncbi:MAG: nitrous oxide reductase accessory protein NosL [Chloroflexi bacterium]|nr:nitrous oxide reductase accessory protein NosL [Chloroflexota bacterium]